MTQIFKQVKKSKKDFVESERCVRKPYLNVEEESIIINLIKENRNMGITIKNIMSYQMTKTKA